MKENKNIERLFQEKFKDFEVSPPEFIWENIQEKLHPEEKKRRVIPFWFKTAGIAASFVALVSLVFYSTNNNLNNTNSIPTNSVVNTENKASNYLENNKFNTSTSNKNYKNSKSNSIVTNSNSKFKKGSLENSSSYSTKNNVVSNNKKTNKTNSNSKFKKGSLENSSSYSTKNNVVSNNKKTNKTNSGWKFNNGSLENSNSYKAKNNFVSNSKKQRNSKNSFKKDKISFTASKSGSFVNSRKNKSKKSSKFNSKFNDFNPSSNPFSNAGLTLINTLKNNKQNSITDLNTFNKNTLNSSTTTIFNSSSNQINNTAVLTNNDIENLINNSTVIASVEEVKMDTITLATVTIEENVMEKLLREKETKKIVDEKEKLNKWAVNSYISPIFFNSFTNGSPLSEEFATNAKKFNNSTSYGVGVAYNLNKRLSVKTGISNLNLDFDTENIAFYSSFDDQSKIANTNIERNTNGKYLVLKHEKDISKNSIENQVLQSNQNLGNLNQKTQYIEVPLEMSYAILNKKIGVAIKGGMSTLFLTENVISINGNDGNMQIGKASNLNNVHFSSNIGLGLSYNFMKNVQLNVEPSLRYQMNTFNKNSDNFTPYVLGVNTGISYKF